jgi:hypothetical protein
MSQRDARGPLGYRNGDLITVNGRPAVFRYAYGEAAVIRYLDERTTRAVCRSKIERRPTG